MAIAWPKPPANVAKQSVDTGRVRAVFQRRAAVTEKLVTDAPFILDVKTDIVDANRDVGYLGKGLGLSAPEPPLKKSFSETGIERY